MSTLVFHRPLSPSRLLQSFGSNDVCCELQDNGVFPVMPFRLKKKSGGVCPRGYKEFYPFTGKKGHDGRDWWGIWGITGVYFSANYEGWLKYASDGDGGIGVEIVSKKPILKCGEVGCAQEHHIKKRYWHLSKRYGKEGQVVEQGDLVGRVGNSGASSGVHLHEATLWCDSLGKTMHDDNGYGGAFDDTPYYVDDFINGNNDNNMMKNIWNWFVKSSKDTQKLALTVKAGVPMLMLIGLGQYLSVGDVNLAIDTLTESSVAIATAVTQVITTYGILRKLWLTAKANYEIR